jgi:hypothetical protein
MTFLLRHSFVIRHLLNLILRFTPVIADTLQLRMLNSVKQRFHMERYFAVLLLKVQLSDHQTETYFIINTEYIWNPKAYSLEASTFYIVMCFVAWVKKLRGF